MERIRELDGLRALAALSVFAVHGFAWTVVRITGAGWIGVDLFFVISGYLITTILLGMRDQPGYFKNFYMRRTLRIFPPYYAFLALCVISALLDRRYHFYGRVWLTYLFYGSSLTTLQSWFVAETIQPGLASRILLAWSLSIEEIFYLLWAPAVRFLRKRQLLLVALSAIVVAPIVRWYVHARSPGGEYYFFPARIDTLACGALLAMLRARRRIAVPWWAALLAFASATLPPVLIHQAIRNPIFAVFGYTLLAVSLTVVVGFVLDRAESENVVCRVLRSRLLVRLGTISYTFYLVHMYVINVCEKLFQRFSILAGAPLRVRLLAVSLASLAVTLLVAKCSWRYFESPILRLKSRFSSGREASRSEAQIGASFLHSPATASRQT